MRREEEFEQLRRLLALKRHEEPPPGYFDKFSREVISRIRAGERGNHSGEGSWLQRLWAAVESKPIFAGAFGAAVCALLITGILNSEETGVNSPAILNGVSAQAAAPFPQSAPAMALNRPDAAQSFLVTNSSTPSLDSLFDYHLNVQPASATVDLLGDGQ
ncbi:MAG TPA: hypothetical protein VFM25_13090 [Verrucomicrobiae bacterium]|nr:hypothetical protein [Verrucomicrobiae bacterium]